MSKHHEKHTEGNDGLQQLIKCGTEMIGSGIGADVGVRFNSGAEPSEVIISAIVGKSAEIALRKLGQEISARLLSHREKQRLGTALGIMVAEIQRRKKAGEHYRTDGFFDEKETGRSEAQDVAESVLLKVQREPEEKKIPYMALLYSSIPFDPDISVSYANQLIKIAEQLTFRQLCILKLCNVKDTFDLRDDDYREENVDNRELNQILYECAELDNNQFINSRGKADLHAKEFGDFGATIDGLTRTIPSRMSLQGIGADLFNLMKLALIPDKDIDPIAEVLK